MRGGKTRIALALLAVALGMAGLFPILQETLLSDREIVPWEQPDRRARGRLTGETLPVYLSGLSWESASTGWVALADDNLPRLDASFLNEAISIGDRAYQKGLGVFPLSEMLYRLGGRYSLFQADIGVDSAVPPGEGSVVFKLFLDDVLAYDSGILRSGIAPVAVEMAVGGVESMKLVVEDGGDGSAHDYAVWADARLVPAGRQPVSMPSQRRASLESIREERRQGREADWEKVRRQSEEELAHLDRVLREAPPSEGETIALFDADRRRMVLANDRVAVMLGFGGERHGLLDILDLESRSLVAFGTTPSLATRDFSTLVLSRHTYPKADDGYRFRVVEDPALGRGMEVTADFHVDSADVILSVRLTLFDAASYLTYQLELTGVEPDADVHGFRYFDPDKGGYFVVGEKAGYLTDYSLIRQAEIRDDSISRSELVGLGKPLVLYDRARSRGMLFAIIDEVPDPAIFSIKLDAGRVTGSLRFEHLEIEDQRSRRVQASPRLFLQVVPCISMEDASQDFRRVMAALYPPLPIPDWVKYQWGSWYAFLMDYDEETIRKQIDYIAANLSDLGPWSILLDAGWYVAEGRPDSDWVVDEGKFPSGLRALVDYAHSMGVRVVLYFGAPYLDDREREGNWMGLRGFIERHPDWVIRLQEDDAGASYVYDFTNPDLVEHIRDVISGFFQEYDVDGIKIDGLGQAVGELLSAEERDVFGDVNKLRMFTMDIYRLVHQEAMRARDDAYIESGWAIPNFANQFAHTFRYGDEFPGFSSRYPAGGLLEHIDYATLQKAVVGQRPNMGMIWGGREAQPMIRLWFEAALAMGSQMTLSTDLTRLSRRDLSALRSVLVHYNAFQGETRFAGVPLAHSFATTTNGITYLGALNREREARTMDFDLRDYGLEGDREYLLYDVFSNSYSRVRGSFSAILDGHCFRLFLLRDAPGVIWTNSSFQTEQGSGSLRIDVSGPNSITGFMQVKVPSPARVALDGRELSESTNPAEGASYSYLQDIGLLRLRYRHDHPHTIEVDY